MKYISEKKDMPSGEHYAILEFSTISIPGDERSRTHPGHGYPASEERVVKYITYPDKETWMDEVRTRTLRAQTNYAYARDEWVPIVTKTVEINIDVQVKIKVGE